MLIFINLIYYHCSPNECYRQGPNVYFDLVEKKKRGRERRKDGNLYLFGNDTLAMGSEHRVRSFWGSEVNLAAEGGMLHGRDGSPLPLAQRVPDGNANLKNPLRPCPY